MNACNPAGAANSNEPGRPASTACVIGTPGIGKPLACPTLYFATISSTPAKVIGGVILLTKSSIPLCPKFMANANCPFINFPKTNRAQAICLCYNKPSANTAALRTLFYLGREYAFQQDWPACQRVLEDYLALPEARWTPERSHAMRLIGACRRRQNDGIGATAWLLRACAEDPWLRENWIDLAEIYNDARDWEGCYFASRKALAIRERPRHYQSFGYAWGERADDLASVSGWYMGLKEKAAEHMRAALAVNPTDARLLDNSRFILA